MPRKKDVYYKVVREVAFPKTERTLLSWSRYRTYAEGRLYKREKGCGYLVAFEYFDDALAFIKENGSSCFTYRIYDVVGTPVEPTELPMYYKKGRFKKDPAVYRGTIPEGTRFFNSLRFTKTFVARIGGYYYE